MYSPKIKPDLVRKLYQHKQSQKKKKPMTCYLNEAAELYLKQKPKKTELS